MTSPTLSNLARRALVPLLLIGTVLAGCTSNPEQRVVDVAIDQADFGLVVGETSAPLTATVDAEAGTSTAVTWSSDDEGVATVAPSGIVTGVGAGTARITATSVADASRSDSIIVTVTDGPAVVSVTIESGDLTLAPGDVTPPLDVTVVATGGAGQDVDWSSDAEGVATVDPNGVVTAVAAGTANVTATSAADGSTSDSILVTVENPTTGDPPAIDAFTATVVPGSRLDLVWTASDADEFDVLAVLDGDPSDTLVIETGLTGTGATIDIPASDRQTLRLVAKGLGPDATAEVVPDNVVTRADDYDPYDLQGITPEPEVPGTLRSVLANAEAGSVVGFASDIDAVTLYGVDLEDVGGVGDPNVLDAHLIIRNDVTVSGRDGTRVVIEGTSACTGCDPDEAFTYRSRMLYVTSGSVVTLQNVVLTGGTFIFDGGGIRNDGDLTLSNAAVTGNRAWYKGGGVWNAASGVLNVTDGSEISNNRAVTEDDEVGQVFLIRGGSPVAVNANDGYGGAIWNQPGGVVTIADSVVSGNEAKNSGGAFYIEGGTVDITDSDVVENQADHNAGYAEDGLVSYGGGIYNDGALTMTNANLSRNTAANQGGGLYDDVDGTALLDTVTIAENTAGTGPDVGAAFGGGIMNHHYTGEADHLELVDVLFFLNVPQDILQNDDGPRPAALRTGPRPGVWYRAPGDGADTTR